MAENVQSKAIHVTTWEDEQMVGYRCSKAIGVEDADLTVSQEWESCYCCGRGLKLHWDVYIEERKENQ